MPNERPPGKIAGGLTCAKGGHRIKNKINEMIMGKKRRKRLEKLKSKEERRKRECLPKVKMKEKRKPKQSIFYEKKSFKKKK